MIVDTGATMVVLSEEIAQKLGLEKEDEVYMRLADNSLRKCFKSKGLLVQFDGRESLTEKELPPTPISPKNRCSKFTDLNPDRFFIFLLPDAFPNFWPFAQQKQACPPYVPFGSREDGEQVHAHDLQ